ncbi:hypothetical protein PAHAL_1G107500 [Panicum hallii]|uniref:Uncharacterized protein n=1 Tax=Panicum hallii TaxID=206008 RepID=A0A2S3GN39_9POAL|nr:hypothetical protein PAHAL_1G107500 [Panicum hallii]
MEWAPPFSTPSQAPEFQSHGGMALTQLQIPASAASLSFIPSHAYPTGCRLSSLPWPKGIQSNPSQMAVLNLGGSGGKENAPPPLPAAHGIAVKNQTMMKRPGAGGKAAWRRPPLRDITCLFLAARCRSPPALADAELLGALKIPFLAKGFCPAGITNGMDL